MKKSKFLFLVPSVALATSVPCIGSCAKPLLSFKDIENAIFNPVEEKQEIDLSFIEQLKLSSKKDLQKELIYRLFAPDEDWAITIRDLYNDGELNMLTNIKTCKIKFNEDKVLASFTGYVAFVFKKADEIHNKNDVIQVLFSFDNLDITPESGTWFLKFELPPQPPMPMAFGIIEWTIKGEKQPFFVINKLDHWENIPNWHNWTNSERT